MSGSSRCPKNEPIAQYNKIMYDNSKGVNMKNENQEVTNMACRDWAALSDEERIERMRQIVKGLQREAADLHNQMEDMRSHKHCDNAVVIPIVKNYLHGFVQNDNWF